MKYNTDAIRKWMATVNIRTMDIEQMPDLKNRFVYRLEQGHDVEFQRLLSLCWILAMSINEVLSYTPVIPNTIMTPVRPEHIGAAIRTARITRGIKQEDLAQRCGITPPTLCRIERGNKPYHVSGLIAVCDTLGTSPEGLEMMYLDMDSDKKTGRERQVWA